MKGTDEMIPKRSDTIISKSTCGTMSTSYQSKEGSEQFMKKQLKTKNGNMNSMKKISAKEKQSRNEKTDACKASVEKEFTKTDLTETPRKLSSVSVRLENENEKASLVKEPKSEATFAEEKEKQLLTATSIVEDGTGLFATRLTSSEKTVAKRVAENDGNIKTSEESGTVKIPHKKESGGRETDVNIQAGLARHSADTFSITSETNHFEMNAKYKDEIGQGFSTNSESEKRKPSPSTAHTASIICSDISPTKLSSAVDKTSSLPSEMKDYQKGSEDVIKSEKRVMETSINSGSEHDC